MRVYELQSLFPTEFSGHGFLIKDYMRDYTKLQKGSPVHCEGSLNSGEY